MPLQKGIFSCPIAQTGNGAGTNPRVGTLRVTREVSVSRRNTRDRSIPNAGIAMSVRCMTPFEMLRVARARFGIGR